MAHFKNVQAFEKLLGICTGYEGSYKPGKQHLQVNALATLSKSTQQVMDKVNEAQSAYDHAISDRKRGFEDLRKLSRAVVQMLKANGVDPLTLKYALAYSRRVTGAYKVRSQPVTQSAAMEAIPAGYSTGKGFTLSTEAFARLIELVEKEPLYTSSEETLALAGLRRKLSRIKDLNEAVTIAEIQLKDARRKRDLLLYNGQKSLYATAMAVKQYVRAVFGYSSSQHQELTQLRFTNPTA
jgi:hypothetical protein